MGLRQPMQRFANPMDIQAPVANRAPAEEENPLLAGAIEAPQDQVDSELSAIKGEEEALAREQMLNQRAQTIESVLSGAAGGLAGEFAARQAGAGLVGRGIVGTGAGVVAAAATAYLTSEPIRVALGLQAPSKSQKDKIAEDAAVD